MYLRDRISLVFYILQLFKTGIEASSMCKTRLSFEIEVHICVSLEEQPQIGKPFIAVF